MKTKTEEYNKRAMEYYHNHRKERNAKRAQRRLDHREEEREKAKQRYRKNCEKIKANVRAYNKAHPEIAKAYREIHKEQRKITYRKRALMRIYGITTEEYDLILESQGGVCAICGQVQNPIERPFAIDHNHTTGKVRGLLCNNCNLILGHARDNTYILENAIHYLKENDLD
jgi:hypothetical protein